MGLIHILREVGAKQNSTLGAHTHAHGFWVGISAILLVMLQFLNTWMQFE